MILQVKNIQMDKQHESWEENYVFLNFGMNCPFNNCSLINSKGRASEAGTVTCNIIKVGCERRSAVWPSSALFECHVLSVFADPRPEVTCQNEWVRSSWCRRPLSRFQAFILNLLRCFGWEEITLMNVYWTPHLQTLQQHLRLSQTDLFSAAWHVHPNLLPCEAGFVSTQSMTWRMREKCWKFGHKTCSTLLLLIV